MFSIIIILSIIIITIIIIISSSSSSSMIIIVISIITIKYQQAFPNLEAPLRKQLPDQPYAQFG